MSTGPVSSSTALQLARGATEDGIVIGNTTDKYMSANPIVRRLMAGFTRSVNDLVARSGAREVHEVGCGEGYWSIRLARRGLRVRGSDFSTQVIALARANADQAGIALKFRARSIYDLQAPADAAELVVCCEVLEHLEHPDRALAVLATLARPYVLISVPREPLWCVLNLARGRYWRHLGNTPGHIQHWSKRALLRFLATRFEIVAVRTPLPWTMVLCRAPVATPIPSFRTQPVP